MKETATLVKTNMEIRQLEAFVAVAREGSFTLAAERLNLSQPSLSARIRQLEQQLNGRLINRDARPVSLTPLGKLFLSYAERVLGILEAAREAVQAAQFESAGEVAVGCPFSLATYLMPEVVNRFSQAFPQAELSIVTGNSDYVVSQLADGFINLAFAAAFPKFRSQAQALLLLHDEMTVAVSLQHPLAGAREVSLAAIWPYRLLLVHWGPAFESYVESLRQMSHNPGPMLRLPLAAALPMAHQANTITFVPRRLLSASDLAEVHVPELSFPWDVALMTRPARSLTPLEEEFVAIVSAAWQSSRPVGER
ncbi:MAG: LysR family transcriptional regulator [Chloroflexi bacterium]|nr:LysR family transcriptional regulator [Chloroflexota bacterium]MCI0579614.1 LysR family transcriptional regulator [Chloroflexota bacterium]MCI0644825.1 LysR family transcriptional regulator [Chloroflexota bacterium]MCI0731449.1 LysR family transcriptional regulator [Chloroflexota bacterium]